MEDNQEKAKPTAGYGNKTRSVIWFGVGKGRFTFRPQGAPKTSEKEECNFVQGHLQGIQFRWNDASGTIAAHESLIVTFGGKDAQGEPLELKVDVYYPSVCARMFIEHLEFMKLGELYGVNLWAPSGDGNSTCCRVERLVGENWVPVNVKKDCPPYNKEEADAYEAAGTTPQEKQERKEEYKKIRSKAVAAWGRPVVKAHEAFVPDSREDDPEIEGDPGDGQKEPVATPTRKPEKPKETEVTATDVKREEEESAQVTTSRSFDGREAGTMLVFGAAVTAAVLVKAAKWMGSPPEADLLKMADAVRKLYDGHNLNKDEFNLPSLARAVLVESQLWTEKEVFNKAFPFSHAALLIVKDVLESPFFDPALLGESPNYTYDPFDTD